jgi:hypothetical protein
VGVPLQKTPSSALSLPCEIPTISQGRPLLALEFTKSGQEEAGSSLHATPFRQKAAVHWMPMGSSSRGFYNVKHGAASYRAIVPLTLVPAGWGPLQEIL